MDVFIIDDRVPDPYFGCGFPRAYRLLMTLVELGHRVTFFPTVKSTIPALNIELLAKHNIFVIQDINEVKKADVAILSRPHNVHYYLPIIKKKLPKTKTVYDTEALWFRRYDLQMEITGRLPTWAYRYDELGMARQVDMCFYVNEIERKILSGNDVKGLMHYGHVLEPRDVGRPFDERVNFLFVGGIMEDDSSNEDALWWFLENAWEEVHAATKASMNVTGKASTKRLKEHQFKGLKLMGYADDVLPLYEKYRVFVAMTRFATGIPWKVHEAMANGIPCIISPLLADQLNFTNDAALVAHTPKECIEKCIQLYTDKDLWARTRQNAFDLIKKDCNPAKFKQALQATLAKLVS